MLDTFCFELRTLKVFLVSDIFLLIQIELILPLLNTIISSKLSELEKKKRFTMIYRKHCKKSWNSNDILIHIPDIVELMFQITDDLIRIVDSFKISLLIFIFTVLTTESKFFDSVVRRNRTSDVICQIPYKSRPIKSHPMSVATGLNQSSSFGPVNLHAFCLKT